MAQACAQLLLLWQGIFPLTEHVLHSSWRSVQGQAVRPVRLTGICWLFAGPGRVMGIIAVLLYGIMVTLSTLYPDIGSMWIGAVLFVILGTVIAAVVCLLVGFLVMPSLASDEVSKGHTFSLK
jgi:hypothetical protein